jgi:hypothetical protein
MVVDTSSGIPPMVFPIYIPGPVDTHVCVSYEEICRNINIIRNSYLWYTIQKSEEIWSYHGDECEDFYLLVCVAV